MSQTGAAHRPVIGIGARRRVLTTSIGAGFHFTLLVDYVDAVAEAGGMPIMLPHVEDGVEEILRAVDGLLLTGGEDVSPELYGETPHSTVVTVDQTRDSFEIAVVREAMARNVPLLAICRGIQVLNVAGGGSLIQDIDTQVESPVPHRHLDSFEDPSHAIDLAANSTLAQVLGATRVQVNSGHHQAVKVVAPGLRAVAWAKGGLIEGLESASGGWVVGVQWHPEMMARRHPQQARLFRALVEASRNH